MIMILELLNMQLLVLHFVDLTEVHENKFEQYPHHFDEKMYLMLPML